jgi:hypothetical protein
MEQGGSRMSNTRSLSFVVATWTALAIGVSMALYAVVQYLFLPAIPIPELVVHHLWHTVALGFLIYVLNLLVFRRVLMPSITKIRVHLYGVALGQVNELELDSDIAELQAIAEGVNAMIDRMRLAEGEAEKKLQQRMGQIRFLVTQASQENREVEKLAKSLKRENETAAAAILERVSELDKKLFAIVRDERT